MEHNVNLDAVDKNGWTALHHACKNGKQAVVRLLLERGASVDGVQAFVPTPLAIVMDKRDEELAELLLANKADIHRQLPLHNIVRHKRHDLVELAALHGADLSKQDDQGRGLLHVAVQVEDSYIVSLLLEHGADSRIPDNRGKTPFGYAYAQKNGHLMHVLLDEGHYPLSLVYKVDAELAEAIKTDGAQVASHWFQSSGSRHKWAVHPSAYEPAGDASSLEETMRLATIALFAVVGVTWWWMSSGAPRALPPAVQAQPIARASHVVAQASVQALAPLVSSQLSGAGAVSQAVARLRISGRVLNLLLSPLYDDCLNKLVEAANHIRTELAVAAYVSTSYEALQHFLGYLATCLADVHSDQRARLARLGNNRVVVRSMISLARAYGILANAALVKPLLDALLRQPLEIEKGQAEAA